MTSHDKPDQTHKDEQEPVTAPESAPESAPPSANDSDDTVGPDAGAAESAGAAEAAAAYAKTQGGAGADAAAEAADAADAPDTAGADAALEKLQAENADLRTQMLRTLADMENLRRRTTREKEDTAKFAISRFAKDLLSVADNLQRALQAIPEDATADNELMQTLAEGVAAVDRELAGVLERHGVKAVDAAGKPFDSNFHEAVMEQPTGDVPPGHVAQVFQTGYTLNDRLLRPAMVAVAKAP